MTENERVERAIASYLEYMELGGQEPDLSWLDPMERRTVREAIDILELTRGVSLGMGRVNETELAPPKSTGQPVEASAVEPTPAAMEVLNEVRAALPAKVRLAADPDVSRFRSPQLPLVQGWIVGTFGGRIRVWLVDVPRAESLDLSSGTADPLNHAFRGLPDTTAIALVGRDRSCLLVEPSDCAPTIEAPSGSFSRKYARPIEPVGEAVSRFLRELVPPWEAIPGFEPGALASIDVIEVAAEAATAAIQSQRAAGARARTPRKEALATLGPSEVKALVALTGELYEESLQPDRVRTRLEELAADQ